ncbi:MAG: NAD(P)/FAD-dependent oxidoreductase [Sedimentisphaerales bacterium]|nr:NAD(P)/FAD-dependent oxidoreductase [Sedimentisphaerales bacterium]HNY78431.1 NAD(P)/FAD-dependent oxidoreductase [Sedimentisphaerales bacterium]HOC63632.1 NAD(P)/FAD-dependent oxidoreductase [Sedimentisphaerales bacterium]HOH64429.1 NAD(P)/FAD-dependent oxidoreductase [Sedimentisphaerales bacterium]HPY49438.1 NAD(P)/FAD-dependent oxidoreductase [Sedimentisphaerales bacterium]
MKTDICVIGAGPAGLMAAIGAVSERISVTVLEANRAAGRKLLVTGGGRCNLTHDATIDEFVRVFGDAGRFLRHSLHEMPSEAIRTFFHDRGLPTTVEPDGCVFPARGRAPDVLRILQNEVERSGVRLLCESPVTDVALQDDGFAVTTSAQVVAAKRLIVATGGLSWPGTGSTGDGYRFASALGHAVIAPKAALVPLVTSENWPGDLAGVALSDVRIRLAGASRRPVSSGAIVFTQDGLGGPAAQDMSRLLADELAGTGHTIGLQIDLMPSVQETELDGWLQQQLTANVRKTVTNVLAEFVPRRLASTLCTLAGCDGDTQAGRIRKETRRAILHLVKALPLHVTGTRPLAEATVTRGGVDRRQIDPKTMGSKLCAGLFFAGELIDVDGPCGGYNLQMCFSTGTLAGRAAARQLAGL